MTRIGRTAAAILVIFAGVGIVEGVQVLGGTFQIDMVLNGGVSTYSYPVDACYNPVEREYLVAWVDGDEAGSTLGISAQRLDADSGVPVGGRLVIVSNTGIDPCAVDVAVAHDPVSDRYIVAYTINRGINVVEARLISGPGAVIGSGPLRVGSEEWWTANYANHPDVAFDGKNFLVTWEHGDLDTQADIRGRFIAPTGDAAGAEFVIDGKLSDACNPVVAYLGAGVDAYLVAYSECETAVSRQARTLKARVVTSDQKVQAELTLSATADNNDWPRIAADATDKEWMVVWERNDAADSWAGYDAWWTAGPISSSSIVSRRVKWIAGAAVPQGSAEILIRDEGEINVAPAIAWNDFENQYVITYQVGAAYFGSDVCSAGIKGGTDTVAVGSEGWVATDQRDDYAPCLAVRPGTRELFVAWTSVDAIDWSGGRVDGARASTIVPVVTPSPGAGSEAEGSSHGGTLCQARGSASFAGFAFLAVLILGSMKINGGLR